MNPLEQNSKNLFIKAGLTETAPFYQRLFSGSPSTENILNRRYYLNNKLYDFIFDNTKVSYSSRNINYEVYPNSAVHKMSIFNQELPDNPEQNYYHFQLFLNEIITELENDNSCLFEISENIKLICFEENLTIKKYAAFYKIKDWHDFMDILQALSKCNLNYRFEMLSSLIIQYAEMCR